MSLASVSSVFLLLLNVVCRQDPHPHGVQGRAGFLRHEAEVSSVPCLAARAGHRHVSRWENSVVFGHGVLPLNRGLKEVSLDQMGN